MGVAGPSHRRAPHATSSDRKGPEKGRCSANGYVPSGRIIGAIRALPLTLMPVDNLDRMLSFQSEALRLRSQRQELLAANMANADTPNYKAVDIDFASALRNATTDARGAAGVPAQPAVL